MYEIDALINLTFAGDSVTALCQDDLGESPQLSLNATMALQAQGHQKEERPRPGGTKIKLIKLGCTLHYGEHTAIIKLRFNLASDLL